MAGIEVVVAVAAPITGAATEEVVAEADIEVTTVEATIIKCLLQAINLFRLPSVSFTLIANHFVV